VARLGRTVVDLVKNRAHWAKLMASATALDGSLPGAVPSRLREVKGFGSNPGDLRMLAYVPETITPSCPLVVVLHGCTQTAAGYDHGAGWSTLADRYGFAVLFPEQQSANNPKLCFNWFQPGDTTRDQGEALSIRHMVERMIREHGVDRSRIFVTGLSAGGAMTSVMLATYPDVFAGGAIVAGLPYGSATNVPEAFEAMYQGRARSGSEWGDLVRAASPHRGPWPKVSIWHGSADATVKAMNADEILKQWLDVHGLPERPALEGTVDGYPRQVWRDAKGEDVIESFTITSMAHGTPLATGDGENDYGAAGPFLLEVGISSTYHIAQFWGLTGEVVQAPARDAAAESPGGVVPFDKARRRSAPGNGPAPESGPTLASGRQPGSLPIDIQSVIEKALKAAGLRP
jgi:poly(hydroxyalkanoate) depolymerase family esterase